MPQKCSKKREMIIVDEREPVGELPPPFPPRNVVVKDDDDVRKFYDLKREIGRGRFGTVYLVTDKETSQKFAAKFVNTKRNQDRGNVEREIEIMKTLNSEKPHPRLIQLYDAFDMAKEMCLILEIVDGGELFERVIDDDFVLTEKACTIFVRQICEGVEFIHSKNILHLDMKPENILCLSREGNRIKICDFGLARKYDPRKKLQVLFGTPEFVAPEVVNFEPISFGTDMWSVGVITYVLLSGLSPFMGHNYVETMTNVTKNKYDFEDEAFKSVSEDAKDFIRKLLVLDKSLRLTPDQCRRHSWLKCPPSNTLHRSLILCPSDSEPESEDEQEDVSIEEKIIKEEKENEKERKKKEDELERQAEVRKKELEQQAELKKRELEKQVEAERKEKEKQEEAKRKEMERKAEAEKKEEELELTKKQLKEFVERWNSHPNSPYLIGTPIPLDLQRVMKTGGWDSRDSFTSVVVGPPSDPGDISEPEDDLDNVEHDEFIRYTIERQNTQLSKQMSPEEVAKELGEKLTLLQQEEIKGKENGTNSMELQKAEVELQNKTNREKSITENVEVVLNSYDKPVAKEEPFQVDKKEDLIKFTEIDQPKEKSESKAKDVKLPKETGDSKMEKCKKAYEERKQKKKSTEEGKKECSVVKEFPKKGIAQDDDLEKKEEVLLKYKETQSATDTIKKLNEKPKSDYKREYEEYLKMVNEAQTRVSEAQVKEDQKSSPTLKRSSNVKTVEVKSPVRKLNGIEKSASLSVVKDLQKKEGDRAGKVSNERKLSGGMKKPNSQRVRIGKENSTESPFPKQNRKQFVGECDVVNTKPKKVDIEEHKKLYQEYLKMTNDNQKQVEVEPNKNEVGNTMNMTNNNCLDHRLQNGMENAVPENSKDLQRRVSESYKAMDSQRKSSAKTIENMPKEPLKRPEIIAIQNEELGGSIPRQRKKSAPRFEIGGENLSLDHASRSSTPGSPGLDGSPSPKLERKDAFDRGSRGPTPTKQLKKQPSRDVPFSGKADSAGVSVRQRPSRDVPVSYSPIDNEDFSFTDRHPSRDLTPEATPSLSRKTSREERPPSRGTREGTPANRRPSRDVPLTPNQLERLSSTHSLAAAADLCTEPQAWPDLIVVPQGEDAEECSSFKESLDVPVATLVKSPSGTLLSIPGVTISQADREKSGLPTTTDQSSSSEAEPTYIPNSKLVAWILDIGNAQNQQQNMSCPTSDRITQWESRDGSPKPTERSRDTSPRTRDRSPLPFERHRDKSPAPNKQHSNLYPLSREPSTLSLRSSDSSDNLYIQTPWGAMKRSPSRTNLSKSPSFEIPTITLKESQKAGQSTTEDLSQCSQSDDHMSVDSSTRSPSPKMVINLQKQDSLDISEIKDFQSCSRLSGELPPKPPERGRMLNRSHKEGNLNINDFSAQQEGSKSNTLPRSTKLMKMNSVSSMKSLANDRKVDNKKQLSSDDKANETSNIDSLKRKSKFPTSPNQKKKLGPLLFSAQDRISQFEQTQSPSRTQRPITRTRSSMVFSKPLEKHSSQNLLGNNLMCGENKNTRTSLISTRRPPLIGLMRSPTFT